MHNVYTKKSKKDNMHRFHVAHYLLSRMFMPFITIKTSNLFRRVADLIYVFLDLKSDYDIWIQIQGKGRA